MVSTSSVEIQDSASLGAELTPKLPNNVVLTHIVTKLSWSELRAQSLLNKTWQRAIQSREFYRERVRRDATETLVAIKHVDSDFPHSPKYTISLYSTRNKTFYKLPPIPHFRGISRYSRLISMDGKLYVDRADCNCACRICTENVFLMEKFYRASCIAQSDSGVYVLDLAGQGQWEKFTMALPKRRCQCNITGCFLRIGFTRFGWGGCKHQFSSSWSSSDSTPGEENRQSSLVVPCVARSLDITPEKRFTIDEKRYCMKRGGIFPTPCRSHYIYFYDVNRGGWVIQHSISSAGVHEIERSIGTEIGEETPVGPEHGLIIEPVSILPINSELLALSTWETSDHRFGYILLQSRGFGSESNAIVWEKAPNSFGFDTRATSAMCHIEL